MRKLVAIVPIAALAFAACDGSSLGPPDSASFTTGPVYYSGQGTYLDGDGNRVLGEEICGMENGAEVDGPYLLWILTANGAASATITGPWGTEPMTAAGGGNSVFKFVSDWYDLDSLIDNVYAEWEVNGGRVRGAVQLVISHGCAPNGGDIGAWCSPGYWGNRTEAIWEDLTGFNFASMFNGNVSPAFYENDLAPDQTIWYVIDTTPPVAGVAGPYGLDARNAAAAFLTSALDGFVFDPDLMDVTGQVCPFNANGEPDPDFYAND
jgi:hypothetical protein